MREELPFLETFLIFLLAAIVVVPAFRLLRANPVIGFLAAGIVIGPHGLAIIPDLEATQALGELGIVFLLFTIGLELSLERLRLMRRHLFGLGSAQVAATTLVLATIALGLGFEPTTALIGGAALAFSSTAVVTHLLIERGEFASPFGRIAFAILLLQDLAVVPLLVLLPLLGEPHPSLLQALGLAGLKAVVMLTTIFGLGRFVLRPLLRVVAQARSAELFAASALLSSLGMAWLAGFAGLSMALGAFLGGVLLAESEYRHQIEADVRPYRAVLLSLFFTTVGMSIDLRFMAASAPEIILAVIGLVIVKAILIAVLCRLFGIGVDQGVRVGLVLAQGSELALVLTALALANGVIADRIAEGLLLVVAVSMALTPALAAAGHRLGMWLERYRGRRASILAATAEAFNDHVVIAGFGRVGQTVARVLAAQEVPFVALDLDLRRVAQGRARGLPVFYGDAGRSDVLAAAGVGDARTAVITLDDPATAERVVQMLRLRFPELQIIVRARDLSQRQSLEKAGATAVVPEALEASLQLSGTVLRSIGIDDEAVDEVIDEFRVDNYARLTEIVPGRETLKRTVKRAAG